MCVRVIVWLLYWIRCIGSMYERALLHGIRVYMLLRMKKMESRCTLCEHTFTYMAYIKACRRTWIQNRRCRIAQNFFFDWLNLNLTIDIIFDLNGKPVLLYYYFFSLFVSLSGNALCLWALTGYIVAVAVDDASHKIWFFIYISPLYHCLSLFLSLFHSLALSLFYMNAINISRACSEL